MVCPEVAHLATSHDGPRTGCVVEALDFLFPALHTSQEAGLCCGGWGAVARC